MSIPESDIDNWDAARQSSDDEDVKVVSGDKQVLVPRPFSAPPSATAAPGWNEEVGETTIEASQTFGTDRASPAESAFLEAQRAPSYMDHSASPPRDLELLYLRDAHRRHCDELDYLRSALRESHGQNNRLNGLVQQQRNLINQLMHLLTKTVEVGTLRCMIQESRAQTNELLDTLSHSHALMELWLSQESGAHTGGISRMLSSGVSGNWHKTTVPVRERGRGVDTVVSG